MQMLRPLTFALLLLPLPARAGTTPEAVWQMMQDGISGAGGQLTAQPNRRGDALVLRHAQIAIDAETTIRLPDITLRSGADGAVALELPPRFPLVVDLPLLSGKPDKLVFQISAPDMTTIFRDITAEALDVSLKAGSISAALDPIEAPADDPDASVFMALAAADLAFDWKSRVSKVAESSAGGALSLGTMHAEMQADIPSESVAGTMLIDLSAVSASLDGFLPVNGPQTLDVLNQSDDPPVRALLDLLQQGMRLKAAATHGPFTFKADFKETRDGPVSMDLAAGSGDAALGIDQTALSYDVGAKALALTMAGDFPDVPFDGFTIGATELRESMALGLPGESVSSPEWGVLYRFAGITLSDEIWDQADPGKTIPRDPISLIVDLAGTYTPDPRLLSAEGWTPGPDDIPFTDLKLGLKEVLLEGAGLGVSGKGDLAFDFADRSRYVEDVPMPEGKLSFLTGGANGLIDTLVTLGLIGPDELTGVRMGLMMLGRAVPGQEDQLSTELEFRDGVFYLNGQKIR